MSLPVRRFGIPDGEKRIGEGLEREGLLSGNVTGLGGEHCGESRAGFWKGKERASIEGREEGTHSALISKQLRLERDSKPLFLCANPPLPRHGHSPSSGLVLTYWAIVLPSCVV